MLAAILAVGTTTMAEEKIASQKLNETVISTENFETSVLDTAKNITIVTQEEIQAKGANTVAEALRGVPGLIITSIEGAEPIFDLRGYGTTASRNTIILVDGILICTLSSTQLNYQHFFLNFLYSIGLLFPKFF